MIIIKTKCKYAHSNTRICLACVEVVSSLFDARPTIGNKSIRREQSRHFTYTCRYRSCSNELQVRQKTPMVLTLRLYSGLFLVDCVCLGRNAGVGSTERAHQMGCNHGRCWNPKTCELSRKSRHCDCSSLKNPEEAMQTQLLHVIHCASRRSEVSIPAVQSIGHRKSLKIFPSHLYRRHNRTCNTFST